MRDPQALAERLAGALAIPTISRPDPQGGDDDAFRAFHRYLAESFPRLHDRFPPEPVGDHHALLFRWPGTQAAAEPWLIISHQDVVPVATGSEADWTHPPFSGAVADGFVWGRGAIDLKGALMAMLEACEALLAEGFRPQRTLYLAFGADEEVGGQKGAAAIARTLEARGVRPAFSLDEGGAVLTGPLPGLRKPVALIGTAEKRQISLQLTARDAGGHSALPPLQTAPARLVRALAVLDRKPLPARLDSPTREMFAYLAPHAAPPYGWMFRNLRLTAPLLQRILVRQPGGNAAARSTATVTRLESGVAGNVIPETATAILDLRLKPTDDAEAVIEKIRDRTRREGVAVRVLESSPPARIASLDSAGFRAIGEAVAASLSDAVPAPCLVPNASDSRHFAHLVRDQYRFLPVRLAPEDLARIHGVDERIGIGNYAEMVRFYSALIRRADPARGFGLE